MREIFVCHFLFLFWGGLGGEAERAERAEWADIGADT